MVNILPPFMHILILVFIVGHIAESSRITMLQTL